MIGSRADDGDKIRLDPRMKDFNQPELTGPGGVPVFVPEDLAARMISDIGHLDEGGGGFEPLAGLSDYARNLVKTFGDAIRESAREHVRVFDTEGREVYRKSGTPDAVSIDLGSLAGNVAIHNHPNGTPPSLNDILIAIRGQALEIQVVSPRHTFSIRPVGSASLGEVAAMWNYLNEMSYAVGQDWCRSQRSDISDAEVAGRRLHALLMELARKGDILYLRNVNVQ